MGQVVRDREFLDVGHAVVGLVRSKGKADALAAMGVTPLLGSLTDLDVVRQGAEEADGVIYTAFGLDFSRIANLSQEDVQAIEIFGKVFARSDRPIVVTGNLGLSPSGRMLNGVPDFPRASE